MVLLLFAERAMGIEPTSSAWKADIMSHYTTPAFCKLFSACCYLFAVLGAPVSPANGSHT